MNPLPLRVLFLDFDGVMHYSGKELPFTRTPLLEKIIDLDPNLDIVISSSWRESFDLEGLRDFFPEKIAARIQGMTPVLMPELVENEDGEFVAQSNGLRQKEIEQYMEEHYPKHTPWVALDDAADLFEDNASLIITPQGITSDTIDAFEHWLKATTGRPVLEMPVIKL